MIEPSTPSAQPRGSQTSTLALVSLIGGITSFTILPLAGAVLAVITGHMAKGEIKRGAGMLTGDGLATAGLILGYANIALGVFVICAFLIFPLIFGATFISGFLQAVRSSSGY